LRSLTSTEGSIHVAQVQVQYSSDSVVWVDVDGGSTFSTGLNAVACSADRKDVVFANPVNARYIKIRAIDSPGIN
jgi:hypothetical protein